MLMNQIREIVDIIGLKKIALAVAIFLGGNGLLYFIAIHPFKAAISQQNEKLKQLTESYIQMKSVDYNKLLQALREQSSLFKEKDSLLQRAVLTEEDIPHFVSKLELEAGAAG